MSQPESAPANVSVTVPATSSEPPAPAPVEKKDAPTDAVAKRLSADQQKHLEQHLANRPAMESLINANIVREGGRLAATKDKLDRELKQNRLAASMESRSTVEQLASSGIMPADMVERGVAPSLQATAKKLERKMLTNSLNQQLYARSELDDLTRSNVMAANNVAPRLRTAKIALEHAITRDRVGHLLESRPDQRELIDSNIIHGADRGVAARIAGVSKQLQYNMTVDRVGHLLERRSDMDDMQQRNILQDARVAPSLQGAQRALQHNLAKSNLYHALQNRPTISELQRRGVYVPYQEGDEVEEEEEEAVPAEKSAEPEQKQVASAAAAYEPTGYQRRSKNFHLTRILLKYVASMAEAGEISLPQKGFLKDLIVDQDAGILAIAEQFDADNDLNSFKEALLLRLSDRR